MGDVRSAFLVQTDGLKTQLIGLKAAIRKDNKAQIRQACDEIRELEQGYWGNLDTLGRRLRSGKPAAGLEECAKATCELYPLVLEAAGEMQKAGKRLSPHLVSDIKALLGPLEGEIEGTAEAAGIELPQPRPAQIVTANPPRETEGSVQEVA
jgi:hypothetical protein